MALMQCALQFGIKCLIIERKVNVFWTFKVSLAVVMAHLADVDLFGQFPSRVILDSACTRSHLCVCSTHYGILRATATTARIIMLMILISAWSDRFQTNFPQRIPSKVWTIEKINEWVANWIKKAKSISDNSNRVCRIWEWSHPTLDKSSVYNKRCPTEKKAYDNN